LATKCNYIPVTSFVNIMKTYEKDFYPDEFQPVLDLLLSKYQKGPNDFYYNSMDEFGMPLVLDTVIRYRADIITKGLVENDRNKLEAYLMTYLEESDVEKTGALTQTQLIEALRKCPKMTLTEIQYLIISQLSPKNEQGLFDYKEHSFDIMIYLKMLFEPKNIKRRVATADQNRYYLETLDRHAFVDMYTLDMMREATIKVGTPQPVLRSLRRRSDLRRLPVHLRKLQTHQGVPCRDRRVFPTDGRERGRPDR